MAFLERGVKKIPLAQPPFTFPLRRLVSTRFLFTGPRVGTKEGKAACGREPGCLGEGTVYINPVALVKRQNPNVREVLQLSCKRTPEANEALD